MRKINFKDISTSSLGFGCSSLTKHLTRSRASNVLAYAFDHGVTHFDNARAYGFGLAENLLGKFAKDKRSKVTITTKFGLESRKFFTDNLFLLNAARKALNTVSRLKSTVISSTGGLNLRELISAENADKSLHQSLRELQTDYVDFFLLHECFVTEANNEELINFFEKSIKAGKIRYVGLAGGEACKKSNSNLADIYNVLQYQHSDKPTENLAPVNADENLHINYNILSKVISFA